MLFEALTGRKAEWLHRWNARRKEARRVNQPLFGWDCEKTMIDEGEHDQRGLMRLMLRLPALRGKLQIMSMRKPELLGLCGAFEDATSTLERLRKDHRACDQEAIAEYETMCAEIEQEVIEICMQ